MMDGPVINGLRKEDHPELYGSIERLMRLYGLKKIRVDINKNVPNAQGKSKLLNDHLILSPDMLRLMKGMDKDETESIMAHELCHVFYRDYHVLGGILLVFSLPFILFCLYYLVYGSLSGAYAGVSYKDFRFWLLLLLFVFGVRAVFWTSRQFEARADREAILKTRSPEAMKRALAKITASMISTTRRPGLLLQVGAIIMNIFFYIAGSLHPTMRERFEQIDLVNRMFIGQKAQTEGPLANMKKDSE
jgi:hypothetical protein